MTDIILHHYETSPYSEKVRLGLGLKGLAWESVEIPVISRVEDERGSLGHVATLRFPSSLIEPDVPISGIRLSGWFHREAHSATARGKRSRRSRPSSP